MKAVYAGSFDCYTNGHHSIVKKAIQIFDELHIIIAVNSLKKRRFPEEEMAEAIAKTLKEDGIKNCKVVIHSGVVADYCVENGIKYLIRGLRSAADYEYEENIALANKFISQSLETIYFRSNDAFISSTIVTELARCRKDVSKLVPAEINKIIVQQMNEL